MANPLIALVGRPNVGKSTFFNKVAGRKIAITENRPGVTRDRLYADAEWRGKKFTVVDTGGIELKSEDTMWREICKQADVAIDTADVILFFTDGREGLTPSDYDVADILRRSKKPVILVVNKIDEYSPDKIFEFYSLGLGEPYAVSAEHSRGIGDVLDEAVSLFPENDLGAGLLAQDSGGGQAERGEMQPRQQAFGDGTQHCYADGGHHARRYRYSV